MASIYKEVLIDVAPAMVWEAIRDVGAIHNRLAPGIVTHTEMLVGIEPPTRRVTFARGAVVDEMIVDVDEKRRRLVWSIRSERVIHHNGAMEVHLAEHGRSRLTWTADLQPATLTELFEPIMAEGMEVMKTHLESTAST